MAKALPKWFKDEIYKMNLKLIDEGWSWDDIVKGYEENIEQYKSLQNE